jgi:hypothetical protein
MGQRKRTLGNKKSGATSLIYADETAIEVCRACSSNDLFLGIDLGELPISNELTLEANDTTDLFPLRLQICRTCSLGQINNVVLPDRLFSDYRYLSSISTTFLSHASNFCEKVVSEGIVGEGDLVVEIACNDGYLLKNFLGTNVKILGVEPSNNVGKIAESLGIPVINSFFGASLAEHIVEEYGYPKLIIANNVMAHVPDLQDFVKGLAILCGPNSVISVENPSILNILKDNQFDTIYHEHFSYLSCSSVQLVSQKFGLSLFDLESLSTHGGSNRYWLKSGVWDKSEALLKELDHEKLCGISDERKWQSANKSVTQNLLNLRKWLEICHDSGETVVGYGAAAKASTLLNAANIKLELLSEICDLSEEKTGRYMPSANYRVITYDYFIKKQPQNILIFPWNISSEIAEQMRRDLPKSKLWVAIPDIKRIS